MAILNWHIASFPVNLAYHKNMNIKTNLISIRLFRMQIVHADHCGNLSWNNLIN